MPDVCFTIVLLRDLMPVAKVQGDMTSAAQGGTKRARSAACRFDMLRYTIQRGLGHLCVSLVSK